MPDTASWEPHSPSSGGGVASVSASAPLASSGGATPDISVSPGPASRFLATPPGAAGGVSLRSIVLADLPSSGVTPGIYTSANLTLNAAGVVTAASSGSGSSYAELRFNPAKRAAAVAAAAASGNNFTLGWSFLVLDAGVAIVGVDYWVAWTGEKTVKFSLWDGDGARVREKTVPVTGPSLVEVLFDTPYSVPLPFDVAKPLTVSAWETSGLWYGIGPESISTVYQLPDGAIQMTTARYGQGGDMFPSSTVGLQYPYGVAPKITIS